jgi:hypothetical protein
MSDDTVGNSDVVQSDVKSNGHLHIWSEDAVITSDCYVRPA